MRGFISAGLFAASLLALTGVARPALATEHDGNWSVLIITEKGDCDRGLRYAVAVENGLVKYSGEAAGINMSGTVTPDGLVKVSIRLGDKGADGTGHLSANDGTGIWRGAGANGEVCAGRWEAERR
jgi:hypothetical protein